MKPRLLPQWLGRMIGTPPPARAPDTSRFAAPVLMGIMEAQGQIYLCDPKLQVDGVTVKPVYVPAEMVERYNENALRWFRLQEDLALLPRSLRPRRKVVRDRVGAATE